jgi:4-hydroxy-3-methylbut-2-enyl diphosphate reductase
MRIGVINQTTMLASETEEISTYLRDVMIRKFGVENLKNHFADTRDTLCYATNENQESTYGLLNKKADLAIVVGGYNSSNTSHIVELCAQNLTTYFISSEKEIISNNTINHFDFVTLKHLSTTDFLPQKPVVDIILTSGASCPDAIVDDVMQKIISFFPSAKNIDEVLGNLSYSS